jgi:hypothetical protein
MGEGGREGGREGGWEGGRGEEGTAQFQHVWLGQAHHSWEPQVCSMKPGVIL